jgi:hypothetical protein
MKVPVQINTTSFAASHLSKHTSTETLLRYASSGAIATVDPYKKAKQLKKKKPRKMGSSKSQGNVGLGSDAEKAPPTFGHRPTSASRHFDKLSMSVNHRGINSKARSAPKMGGGTGMSLGNLKALFDDPPVAQHRSMRGNGSTTRLSPINNVSHMAGMNGDSYLMESGFPSMDGPSFDGVQSFNETGAVSHIGRSFHDPAITAKPSQAAEMEGDWNNSVYLPPKIKRDLTHLPANPEESVKERMARYAKISAGVLSDERVPAPVRHRPALKSPRTMQTDDEVAMIFKREKERQQKIAKMEEKYKKMVKKERMRNFKKDLKKKVEAKGGPVGNKKAPHVF